MAKIITVIAIVLIPTGSWIANIIKITSCSFSPLEAEAVIRCVGVFVAPLGVVLGFIPHW